jgi:hypothetical protein
MSETEVFLDYRGPMDFDILDSLLRKLKKTREFKALNKTTAKRTYSLIVECLENICKHAELNLIKNPVLFSHLTVGKENDKIIIRAGNPVSNSTKEVITGRLNHVNMSDEQTLQTQYEEKIKIDLETDEKCAGLGFIYMALKSGNKLEYTFKNLINGYLYYEIQITLNNFTMRKLIIDQKSNSPKIILDPEKAIFLISGESRPPDVREFYAPVLTWLEDFTSYMTNSHEKEETLTFNFNFEYFNSSSGKLILDMCKILVGLSSKGIKVKINWQFEKDDYDMLEAGKEMSRIVRFPFEYVETLQN